MGILANLISKNPSKENLIGTVLLGILGATLGGLLADLLFKTDLIKFSLSSLIISMAGSFLLLFIDRAVSKK